MMRQEEPPEDLKRKLKADPRYYMANFWRHPSDPSRNYDFKTTDGEHLYYMTDEDSPLKPENWGDINVLLFCRGGLKTTTVLGITNWATDMYPTVEVDMTAPREHQTHEYVERFKDRAEESGLAKRRTRNKLSHQKFRQKVSGEHGNEHVVYSHLKQRTGWGGGDSFRGLHGNLGVIDEFQDADEDMFSNFQELVTEKIPDNDIFPTTFIIGTPKRKSSFYHKMWQASDQKTWDQEKREWIQQDEADSWGDDDIGSFEVRGWHLDAHNCPLKDEAEIEFKRSQYSERRFKNEVEAKFYSPEDDLLTVEDIRQIYDPDNGFRDRRRYADSDVVVAVDWGGGKGDKSSDTMFMAGEKYIDDAGDEVIEVLNIDFLDSSATRYEEQNQLEQWLMKYQADKCVVDYGHGSTRVEALQDGQDTHDPDGYPNLVKACQYGNVKDRSEIKWESSSGKKRFFTCNRSHMMESTVSAIKDGDFIIPSGDLEFDRNTADGHKLESQLTAPYIDKDETPSGKKKVRIEADRNDDAMHTLTYLWIGFNQVLGSSRQVSSISARTMEGY